MAFAVAAARPARRMALCLLLLAGAARSQSAWQPGPQPAPANATRAAYLYRFAAFVDWPQKAFARADSPLTIGIAGDDALAALVEQAVAGRSVRGRRLAVRRLRPGDDARDLQILYVADSDARAALLASVRHQPVLTVCDIQPDPLALPEGCVVQFVPVGEHLRFHVARDQAAAANLRISARLLAVQP